MPEAVAECTEVATIVAARIGYEHHGILAVTVGFELEGNVFMGLGSYSLGAAAPPGSPNSTNFGAAFIAAVMGACGVTDWARVQGSKVLLLTEGPKGRSLGFENLPGQPGRRFIIDDLLTAYRPR